MTRATHRFRPLAGLFAFVLVLTAATQAATLRGGYFKANNGTNEIGIAFDTTGTLNVSVDGQAFGQGTWESKGDTVSFGPSTAPEGYACAGSAKYLWSIAENRVAFTHLADDCEIRVQSLTGLTWTKG
jgi:hypothetical protein